MYRTPSVKFNIFDADGHQCHLCVYHMLCDFHLSADTLVQKLLLIF